MILVIAEQKDGKLNRASWETIAAAQQLAGGAMPIKVAVAGPGRRRRWPRELAQAAVAEVIAVDHAALAHYTPDAFVQALQQVIDAGGAGAACSCRTPTRRATSRRRWRRGSIARSSPT